MPHEYESTRDSIYKTNLKKRMKPKQAYDQAQQEAAAIYNKRHPGNPVTRGSK